MKQFILQFIQPERLLHMRATTQEMFQISSLLYGGVSFFGLLSLLFPTWVELDKQAVAFLCSIGLMLSVIFYIYKDKAPIWLAIVHIPLGIMMVSVVVYVGHAEQSTALAVIYVLSSAFLFHYIKKAYALIVLAFAMLLYALALRAIGVEGWPAIVVFVFGNCLTIGLIVGHITNRMHTLSIKDTLTGLLNRQTINALIYNLLIEHKINERNIAFIMIDLNDFKLINDTHGHLEGDKILIRFSQLLEAHVAKDGHVARWGGDEFIVVLNINYRNDVINFEQKLRGASDGIIGFEMGVSHPESGDTLDSLMHRADKSMYINKHSRRSTD